MPAQLDFDVALRLADVKGRAHVVDAGVLGLLASLSAVNLPRALVLQP